MALQSVSLANLDRLDPKLQAAFHTHLRRAVQDCLDRPGEKKSRRVLMELDVTPILDEDGGCSRVHADFNFRDKLPDRRSRTYELIATRNGSLIVNEHSPENPDQMTIDDIPAPGAEVQVPKLPAPDGKAAAAGD
ncbi:MAG: hypothetical protein AB7U73_01105 [Pirellulales bacterium]